MASEDASLASPSSHRLPTISASQALHSLHARGARTVSTGIWQLDQLLVPQSLPGHPVAGGYMRGKVTEIFGPPGVGKTSFGIQAAVNALHEGQHAVWVEGACAPLVPLRLLHVFSASRDTPPTASPQRAADSCGISTRFHHFVAPTLAHLLALFMHPPASFPPKDTSLVVVDSLSTLIENAYPRHVEGKNKNEHSRWAAGRRFTIINEIMATLSRFAALHNVALLFTCQAITRIRGASRALLVPAVSGVEWETGVSTRLVLFRDWTHQGKQQEDTADSDRLRKARFAGLVKVNGTVLADEGGVGSVVLYSVEKSGLCNISTAADDIAAPIVLSAQARPLKRPFAEVEDEDEDVGDEPNSDELYGWIEEDDEVATEGLLIHDPAALDPGDIAASRTAGG
ncbi:hypothetical protein ACEQ8H_004928 [Pleosporales sp. CAS-2024a]